MSEKISWNYVAKAINGPNISAAGNLEVDAYDKLQITLGVGKTQNVQLVPTGASVSFLAINPQKPDKSLTYTLGSKNVALDGPLVLIGNGAVSLLGGAGSLDFTNGTSDEVVIEILTGRDATP